MDYLIKTIFIALLVSSQVYGYDLKALMKDELNHLAVQLPGNSANYIRSINSKGEFISDVVPVKTVEQVLGSKYGLPKEVVDKFKGIIYAAGVQFQSFHLLINGNTGSLKTFVGLARKNADNAEMIFINVNSSGSLVQQYNSVKSRSCHRILFVKKCHDNWTNVPRGLNTNEIANVSQSLQYSSYQYLVQKLDSLKTFSMLKEFQIQVGIDQEVKVEGLKTLD